MAKELGGGGTSSDADIPTFEPKRAAITDFTADSRGSM
jgi:hypothetical protein